MAVINVSKLAREVSTISVGKDFDKALVEELETVVTLLVSHGEHMARSDLPKDPPRKTILARDLYHASDKLKVLVAAERGD